MFNPIDHLLRVRQMIHVARQSHMVALMCLLAFLLSCGNHTPADHGARGWRAARPPLESSVAHER